MRANSDDKFALVEARLEDLLRECAINAELIESERLERERSASLGRNVLEAFKFAIGQRSNTQSSRGLPASSSFASITNSTSPTSPPGGGGSPPWASHGRLRSTSNGSNAASSMMATTSSNSSLPSYTSQGGSPPRYPQTLPSASAHSNGSAMYTQEQTTKADVAPEWYERGILYWAFLPLNLSNSVLRYAGDRMSSTSAQQQAAALRQRRMIGPPPPPQPPQAMSAEAYAALQQQQHTLHHPPSIQVTHPSPVNTSSGFDTGHHSNGVSQSSPTHSFAAPSGMGQGGVVTSSPTVSLGKTGGQSSSGPWKSGRMGSGRAVKV